MTEQTAITVQRSEESGTTSVPGPVNFFSMAHYHDAQGRRYQLPVQVAGDHFTLQPAQAPGQSPA